MKFIVEKKWPAWLLILVIFVSGSVEAQDYIESHAGEVSQGRVIVSFDYSDYKHIDFENEAGGVIRYRPGEIAGFGLENGRRFVSKELPHEDQTVFAQKVFSGVIILYRYQGNFYLGKGEEILHLRVTKAVKEVEGKKAMATRKSYVGILNRLMAGSCGIQLKSVIDETKLKQEDLVSLLRTFHECENLAYEIPGEKIPLMKISPMLMLGAGNVGLLPTRKTAGRADAFENSIRPFIFMGLRFHAFKHSPRVFYDLGISASRQANSIYSAYYSNDVTITGREDHSTVTGLLPFSANYLLRRNSFNEVYVGVGITALFSRVRRDFAIIDFKESAAGFKRDSDIFLQEKSFYFPRSLNGAPHIKIGSNFFVRPGMALVLESKIELFPDQYRLHLMYNHARYNQLFSSFSLGLRF